MNQYSSYMNNFRMKLMIVVCFVAATGGATLMLLFATFELHVIITCNGVIFIIFIFVVYVNLIERLKAHVKRMEMSKSSISKKSINKNSDNLAKIENTQESKNDIALLKSSLGNTESGRSPSGHDQDDTMQERVQDPSRLSCENSDREKNLDRSAQNLSTKPSTSGMELSRTHFASSEPKQNPDISDEIQSLDAETERTSDRPVENSILEQIPDNIELSRSDDGRLGPAESHTILNTRERNMKNAANIEVAKSSVVNQGPETNFRRPVANETTLQSTNKQLSATRTIQVLLACIFITYMPYNVTSIVWTYHRFLKKNVPAFELYIIYAWSCFLAMINSCGNAIIIIYFNSRSRRFVLSLIKNGHVAGTT
eukprot:Seg1905.2 transcript_id=Seg1905.2/GoldUCD/mRNA.D3Y31 product="hypothetical protein" protein_id=Seg1905.2/GoldUCD/D3Y31